MRERLRLRYFLIYVVGLSCRSSYSPLLDFMLNDLLHQVWNNAHFLPEIYRPYQMTNSNFFEALFADCAFFMAIVNSGTAIGKTFLHNVFQVLRSTSSSK